MNFVPKMSKNLLMEGYKSIIYNIYATKPYYSRIRQFMAHYNRPRITRKKLGFSYLTGFVKSMVVIGIANKGRREYWKFLVWTLFNKPRLLMDAIVFTVYGYHFRTVYGLKDPDSFWAR